MSASRLAWRARYGLLGVLGVIPALAPACGGDDTDAEPTGSAGAAATSTSGAAGSGSTTSTTSAGTGGAGGSATGAGGTVGSAGSTGGTAGTTGGAAGAPSDAGSDATDGSTGPAAVIVPIANGRHARFFGVAYAAGGIYALGQVGDAADANDMATFVAKVLPSGALDTAFGTGGIFIKNVATGAAGEIARGIVVQSNGKIVVSGVAEHGAATESTRDIFAMRLLANGTIDATFGMAGVAKFPLANGELVQQWGLSKYDNDDLLVTGARKATPAPTDAAAPGDADPDAAPEAGTDAGPPPSRNEFAVLKIKGDNGAADTAFGTADGVFGLPLANSISPRTATILSDGKIVVSGYTNSAGNKPVVFKLTAAGALDTTFATGGIWFPESGIPGFGAGGSAEAYGAALQGDKFVTVGYGRETSTQPANGWVSFRLNADGTLDNTYGTMGHVFLGINDQAAAARGMVMLGDNRPLLIGGGSLPKASADAGTLAQSAGYVILTASGALDPSNPQGPKLYDLGGPATGRAAHFFWGVALSPDKKSVAIVGIKGGVTGNADAGIMAGTDQAAFLHVPTGN